MGKEPTSRDALIAAALAGELSEAEHRRFAELYASDAGVREEFDGARSLMERIDRAGLTWSEERVPEGLAERVQEAVSDSNAPGIPVPASTPDPTPDVSPKSPHRAAPPRRTSSRRRPARRFSAVSLGAVAASALVVGALGTATVSQFVDAPPDGPPGTLGAVEPVSLTEVPEGTEMTASLVAHTWGTETLLEIDGLDVGETFEVVLKREDGRELVSGTFLGSRRTVLCSMNAAVLREDVSEVEIRDEGGAVVASAAVPDV
jgi:hypothetical protein